MDEIIHANDFVKFYHLLVLEAVFVWCLIVKRIRIRVPLLLSDERWGIH